MSQCCWSMILGVALAAVSAAPLGAQDRELLRGTVRNATGDSLPNARVRAIAVGVDTIVRADFRGRFSLILPRGQAQLTATMLGFRADSMRIDVTGADTVYGIRLQRLAQQVAEVVVRAERWVGMRGVVGDEATMQPLAGVVITSMKRDVRVVTDSLGRFEFRLPKPERTAVQLSQPGYVSRPAVVTVQRGDTTSLVLLMKRGADPTYIRFALSDLGHRMAWAGIRVLVADRQQLSRRSGKTLEDGLYGGSLLSQRGIQLGRTICLFVNGEAQPNRPLWSISLADVDFVEVWARNTEQFGSLQARWPGGRCGSAPTNHKGGGPWVSVWLTNQQ